MHLTHGCNKGNLGTASETESSTLNELDPLLRSCMVQLTDILTKWITYG